jgi:hypothetical protein
MTNQQFPTAQAKPPKKTKQKHLEQEDEFCFVKSLPVPVFISIRAFVLSVFAFDLKLLLFRHP